MKTAHLFAKDLEEKLDYTVDELSILLDLKVLLKDYYAATFSIDGKNLKISFNNGQSFTLTVKETK